MKKETKAIMGWIFLGYATVMIIYIVYKLVV